MKLTSPAFKQEGKIPPTFTCDDKDISPVLVWEEIPAGTESLALILDDPDAPGKTWVHWLLYNIPSATRQLPENMPESQRLESGMLQGRNDFGRTGYGGPCPPPHHGLHHYCFKLYALDSMLDLGPGAHKEDLETTMEGHILDRAQLIGLYKR